MIKKNKGFTLVELIIVIAIIGILAAVLIPTVSGYITKARRSNDVQLAGAMTNEVQNYCAKYDIDQSKLLGTDIRTILLYREFDLTPRKDEWTFVYNIETKKVEVVDFNEGGVFAADEHAPLDPTHLMPNYYLIGKGTTNIEKAVNLLCNLQTSDDYDKAINLVSNEKYKAILQNFDPKTTLYITKYGAYTTATEAIQFTKIVCLEKVTHLPKITLVGQQTIGALKSTPQTLRTSEEVNPSFPNVKVYDLNKVKKINLPQFGQDYSLDKEGTSNYIYKFQLGEHVVDSKMQVFSDEILSVQNDGDTTIIKRKFTVNYYTEDGLYARGSFVYSIRE